MADSCTRNTGKRIYLALLMCSGMMVYFLLQNYQNKQLIQQIRNTLQDVGPLSSRFFIPERTSRSTTPFDDDDTADQISNDDLVGDIFRKYPMLPSDYLYQSKMKRKFNKTCARFPNLFELNIHNNLWQHVHLKPDRDLYLFSAHVDSRRVNQSSKATDQTPVVRLLGMTNQDHANPPNGSCQFWFDDDEKPSFSPATKHNYLWNFAWGPKTTTLLVGIIITCPITKGRNNSYRLPQVVSFVENKCDKPTNALRVQRPPALNPEPPPVGSIAVCIKGMSFWYDDRSFQLVEWLELAKLLGAQKVYTYDLTVHPNMRKVLEYYERTGFVDLKPYTLPGSHLDGPELLTLIQRSQIMQKRFAELIPYNDCLYRNWYRYEYLLVIDTDEMILPVQPEVYTWSQLIAEVVRDSNNRTAKNHPFPYASICARNVHFVNNETDFAKHGLPGDVPPYLYMLSHVSRLPRFEKPGSGVKCFHATSRVLTVHNHAAFRCLDGCKFKQMDTAMAHMQHYRSTCTLSLKSRGCRQSANDSWAYVDTTVWKYKAPLIDRCNTILKDLDMIKT